MMGAPRVGKGAKAGKCIREHGAARHQMILCRNRHSLQGESRHRCHSYSRRAIILGQRNCRDEGCVVFATLPHRASRPLASQIDAVECDCSIRHIVTFAHRHRLLRLVVHQPRHAATYAQLAPKFQGRKACLGQAGQLHRQQLGGQRQLDALKDRCGDQRSPAPAGAIEIACVFHTEQPNGRCCRIAGP